MLAKKTILDKIEITGNGEIQFRLALLINEDEHVLSSSWHRATLEKNVDFNMQIENINLHLISMGFSAIADISLLQKVFNSLTN